MTKAIIFKNDNGGVSVIKPSIGTLLTVDQIAAKDTPAGKPYKIVDASEVPSDRTFRNSWTVDESTLTDGIGYTDDQAEEMVAKVYVLEHIAMAQTNPDNDPDVVTALLVIQAQLLNGEITAVKARELIPEAYAKEKGSEA